ncbi:MAG: HNH endonuclease [Bacteroidetes bacterium]|nr:HNH endonuclease [Bacteroidota bacterium]
MKNPNWNRDELILALDLYFDLNNKNIDSINPKIIELSAILNSLPYHQNVENQTFRNANGVAMKLGNFRRFDETHIGKGLSRGGKLEEVIWLEFFNNRSRLKEIASNIKSIVQNKPLTNLLSRVEEDDISYEVKEGNTLYKLHKFYERNQTLIKKKKQSLLDKYGALICEVCDFNFKAFYGSIGEGFIECHHNRPLHTLKGTEKITLGDLSPVCSNCHRMLHRNNFMQLTINDLNSLVKENGYLVKGKA